MVAALVLGTFVCFVVVDYFLQTRRPQAAKAVVAPAEPEEVSFPMNIVGGFKLPAGLSYHSGHAWAAKESRNVVVFMYCSTTYVLLSIQSGPTSGT